ncbi:MAG: enoyl-CoA hydratase [Desulfohalobiaceae bacterium]
MSQSNLVLQQEGHVAHVTLNLPEKRNALSKELLQELTALLQDIAAQNRAKAVIIKGAGQHFSSGHNLKEVLGGEPQEVLDLFQTCYQTMQAIRDMPQPVIAQVHGVATAAGCQLVAACDLAVASQDARFGTPGVKIGLFCSTPAVFLSRSIGRKKALEMLLTGELIPAQEALAHGLVNKVVPAQDLEQEAKTLAENIAQYSLNTLGLGKELFYKQVNMEDFQALAYATQVISLNSTSPDAKEGISAFLEKRTPQWKN